MSDKSEEVKKAHFESAVALKPEGLVTPQPVRKKREMAAYPKSNSHRNTKLINTKSNNEMRPQNLFEKNRFRAKHRSKSPVNKEVNSKTKTKIITFDSDSENKVNPIADNESEIQLEGVDFDTSGDSSEELVSDNFEEKQKSVSVDEEEFYFTKNEWVIIASIKLPLKAIKDENGKFKLISSGSLLFSQMFYLRERNLIKSIWVGLPGYTTDLESEKQELTELYQQHDWYPIFIDEKLSNEYFYFWENIMKPLFYNFKGLYDDIGGLHRYDEWSWFKIINEKFSEKIIEAKDNHEESHPNAFIWLNNHQLFLVPQFLRKKIKDSHIGLYIHSPFPSSDIFKIFPYRNMILKSILEWDCIGFHAYEHARHFWVTCKRVLGIETEMAKGGHLIINPKSDKSVMIRIGHAGVATESIIKIIESEEFKNKLENREVQNRIIISSIDPLSHFSGIRAKLIAYSKFLRQRPINQRDCKLIQYLTIPKVFMEENLQLTYDSIIELKNQIVAEFGDKVLSIVEYQANDDINKYLIWGETDVLFITNK